MNEQIAVVREKVNMLAEDKEGLTLTLADLDAILRTLGLHPTVADLEDLISTRQQDDQGRTDFEDFMSLMIIDVPKENYYCEAEKRRRYLM